MNNLLTTTIFVFCSYFFSSTFCFASNSFVVRDVEGSVFVRSSTSVNWIAVKKNVRLKFGQLMMVKKNSAITLEVSSKKVAGMKSEKTQLTLTRPLVTRLGPHLFRDVKIDAFFLTPSNVRGLDNPESEAVSNGLTLKDAWKRLSTILSRVQPSEPPAPELSELERIGMTVAHSSKKIEILSPEVNAFIQNSDLPAELKVVWKVPKHERLNYEVYFWPVGISRNKPVDVTRFDFHTLKIIKSGVYFVQVASTNGVWQSSPHAVHISLQLSNDLSDRKFNSQEDLVDEESVFPTDDYVSAVEGTSLFKFSWNSGAYPGRSNSKSNLFHFVLKDKKNIVVFEKKTTETELSIPLQPGQYFWSLKTNRDENSGRNRKLTIVDSDHLKKSQFRSQLIKDAMSSGSDITISLGHDF